VSSGVFGACWAQDMKIAAMPASAALKALIMGCFRFSGRAGQPWIVCAPIHVPLSHVLLRAPTRTRVLGEVGFGRNRDCKVMVVRQKVDTKHYVH
jgi:hypothetical protein